MFRAISCSSSGGQIVLLQHLPLLPWCSVSNPPLPLVSFRTPCSWDIHRGRSIATRDTVVPMDIEVPTKYPLSQDRIVVFEIRLHSKSPMLYRPALHGNWNALRLARRALKDKFPTPTVPLTTVLQNRQVLTFICLRATTLSCDVAHRTVRSWRQKSFGCFHVDLGTRYVTICVVSLVAGRRGGKRYTMMRMERELWGGG
jgi:glycerol-3-phosphate O-acyltransferase